MSSIATLILALRVVREAHDIARVRSMFARVVPRFVESVHWPWR
jgi:hypothetical protein